MMPAAMHFIMCQLQFLIRLLQSFLHHTSKEAAWPFADL